MYLNKYCVKCGKLLENVHHSKMYCNNCKKEVLKDNQRRCRKKNFKPKYTLQEFKDNLLYIADEPYKLTTKGFNLFSKISVKSYCNTLDRSWINILKIFNKYDELLNYIKEEILSYYNKNKKISIRDFCNNHKYITYELIYEIGIDDLFKELNIKIKRPYTEKDLLNNFNNVRNKLNKIPTYSEFEDNTEISINTYANFFKLKGNVYDEIVKIYVNKSDYIQYNKEKKLRKRKMLFNNSSCLKQMNKLRNRRISDSELKDNFVQIFNDCYNKFNTYPSRRYFNKVSKYDDSVYRHHLKMSWTNICKYYGFEPPVRNVSEKIVLETIKFLTKCNYKPQKTWKWLIGAGGKNMYCDGFFKDLNLVIEFDGSGHRKPIEKYGGYEHYKRTVENDKIKDELIPKHGYKLIRIDSRELWYDIDYLKNLLIKNNIPVINYN